MYKVRAMRNGTIRLFANIELDDNHTIMDFGPCGIGLFQC
jgi:hypothetical protein